jgi:uncharacterized protein (TIGR03067 family)
MERISIWEFVNNIFTGEIAMRFSAHVVASIAALFLIFAAFAKSDEFSFGYALSEEREVPADQTADAQKGDWPLVGTWHGLSVSIPLGNGNIKTLTDDDGAVSLVVSEKTITLRVGAAVLAEMTYEADPKQKPCSIDLKTKDGEMLGIYQVGAERLSISINDKAKGRPKDFRPGANDMVLLLRRVYPVSLYTIDADGSNLRRVLTMPEFTFIGSPEMSPDGRKIAFDTWRATMGEQCGDARIFVVNADGGEAKDLGFGAMPSWSPDEKQLTCSQYGKRENVQRGVWIMNADGSDPQLIDANGWASQWSPKNNEIAYVSYGNDGAELTVYDVAKKTSRTLPLEKTYRQIIWGLTWSPDGKWVCFKGDLTDGGSEIAAVSAEEGKKGFKVVLPSDAKPEIDKADATIGWGGAENQIVLSTQSKTDGKPRLYFYDFAGVAAPKPVPGIPADWYSFGPAASADGKVVVFAAVPPMQPEPQK